MSIYPVKLKSFYRNHDEYYRIASSIVSYAKCVGCGGRIKWRSAIADHSIAWGYDRGVWCSKWCFEAKRKERGK